MMLLIEELLGGQIETLHTSWQSMKFIPAFSKLSDIFALLLRCKMPEEELNQYNRVYLHILKKLKLKFYYCYIKKLKLKFYYCYTLSLENLFLC